MLNRNGNGGDGLGRIIPAVVQSDQVEENRTLVPQQALDAVPAALAELVQLSNHSCIFAHAFPYYWYVEGVGDVGAIHQEARGCIVSSASLLDHFSHRIEYREGVFRAHAK